jgi:hypothetical protein
MKKKLVLAGIISALAVFGFILASCDNGSTDNGGGGGGGVVPSDLIGKWSTIQNDLASTNLQFEFTANEFIQGNTSYTVRFTGKKCEYQQGGAWTAIWDNYIVTENGTKLTASSGGGQRDYYKIP